MTRRDQSGDIDDEIEFHLREVIEALVSQGWEEAAARQEAERRYGNRRRHAAAMARVHEPAPDRRSRLRPLVETFAQECRFALRGLRRAPAFTLTTIATLALVTGANLTMFGIADGLMFRPLKYLRDPSSVQRVYWQWQDRGRPTTSASTQYTRFIDFQRDASSFSEVAVFADRNLPVGDGIASRERRIAAVSGTYFGFFDAQPVQGRFFGPADDQTPRGADVAVLGYRFWRSQFNGADVIGRTLRVGDIQATIVGIAPEGFDGVSDAQPPAAFVPITTYAASTGTSDAKTYYSAYRWGWVHLLVRLKPGVTLAAATDDATRVFRASWPQFIADNGQIPAIDTAHPKTILSSVRLAGGPTSGPEAQTSLWLLGVAMAVLLIGCGNVVNLSLTRVLGRRHETGLKCALGVGSRRLLAAGFIEAGLLAIAGGIAALLVAQALRIALAPILESLRIAELSVFSDQRTLIATGVLIVVTTALVGLVPALFQRRDDLGAALRGGARVSVTSGRRARAALLIAQATLSVVLLVAAGLFVRSLIAANASRLGYDPDRVLVVNRVIQAGGFDAEKQRTLREDLLRAAQALPQVESAAWMSSAPFVSTSSTDVFVPRLSDANALGPFTFQATTAGYFETMGTRVIRGRALTDADRGGAPEVAVVSESMARALWPDRDALGACFHMRSIDSPCRTVVGIAEDMVQRTLADGPRLHYYVPIDQYPRTFGNGLLLKLRGEPRRLAEDVRVELQRVMPANAYLTAQPLADILTNQRSSWRLGATVLVGLASLALIVAAVGLYGAVGYEIAQRRQEWAVRVALGADRMSIITMIVGRTLSLIACGIVPGLFLAAAFGRWIRPLLYQTSGFDPLSYLIAAGAMAGVAVLASTAPALRAARADPQSALRN
ncbi:MAG TPA: ABC transporter permease [Vicinamibacterales bacterium]|nr:ABC transporter permease [Vicinamibacterales bacterium]